MSLSGSSFSTVEAVHRHARHALCSEFDERCTALLEHWHESDPTERIAARAYIFRLRDQTLRSLLDVNTLSDLRHIVAMQYVELKCRWTVLNTRIQHHTSRDGQADPALTYRAAGVSLLIDALEPLLPHARIDALTAFLSEPMDEL